MNRPCDPTDSQRFADDEWARVAPWGKEWEEIVNKRVEDMIQNHKPKCKTCGYNTHCASPNVCDIGENPDYDDIKDDPPVHYPEDEIPYD